MSQNTVKLQADWNRHYAAPVELYQYSCVVDFSVLYLLLLQYALTLSDLYSKVSLSLQNPTPTRLSVRNI